MPQQDQQEKASVTLEKLLHLKRSERPDASFWEGFDREFQRRRLATLVTTPPWYIRAAGVVMVVLRRTAPVGAAAAALAAGYLAFDQVGQTAISEPIHFVEAEADIRYTLLPEEHIAPSAQGREMAAREVMEVPPARIQPTYPVHEFGIPPATSRAFVTVASPHTLSVSDRDSGVYRVHTLTARPADRPTAEPVAGSF